MASNNSSSNSNPLNQEESPQSDLRDFPLSIPRVQPKSQSMAVQDLSTELPKPKIVCPYCDKDDKIQKVSSIVLGGTSSGTYSGPSGGVTYSNGKYGSIGGYSTLRGTSQTSLAYMLTPPEEPKVFTGYFGGEKALLFFGAITGCGSLIQTQMGLEEAGFIGVGGFFLAMIIFIGVITRKDNRVKKETDLKKAEKLAWKGAMEKWIRLYYCERDDLVFDPITKKTCHPVEILNFIYNS